MLFIQLKGRANWWNVHKGMDKLAPMASKSSIVLPVRIMKHVYDKIVWYCGSLLLKGNKKTVIILTLFLN